MRAATPAETTTDPAKAVSAGESASLRDWQISSEPLIETSRERVYAAAHRNGKVRAWYHVISSLQGKTREQWDAHFSKLILPRPDVPFVGTLLGWGFQDNLPFYLTKSEGEELLSNWKPLRKSSSATSLRTQLMLQAIQLAQWLGRPGETPLDLKAALMVVLPSSAADCPYQLQTRCLLPVQVREAGSGSAFTSEFMEETSRILDSLLAGMPWLVELSSAFHNIQEPARTRLAKCEKILSGRLAGGTSAEFSFGSATRSSEKRFFRRKSTLAGAAALAIASAVVGMAIFSKDRTEPVPTIPEAPPAIAPTQARSRTEPAAAAPVPPLPPTPAVVAAVKPLPPLIITSPDEPTEISVALDNLHIATSIKSPNGILNAAIRVIQVQPGNEEATLEINKVLRKELRNQIEMNEPLAGLKPDVSWPELAELGFQDARILSAASNWLKSTDFAYHELMEIAQSGSTEAAVILGQYISRYAKTMEEKSRAFQLFKEAADAGDSAGQYLAGECLWKGFGTPANLEAAIPYFSKSAEAGDARALSFLGNCYLNGTGLKQDPAKFVELFTEAAGRGNAAALANLASLFLNGKGVEKNEERALTLLRLGDKKDNPQCTYLLARCAERGTGMKKDPTAALKYYSKASRNGHKEAGKWLEEHQAATAVARARAKETTAKNK